MNAVISLMQQCKVIFAYHIRFLEGVVDIPSTPNEFFRGRGGREGGKKGEADGKLVFQFDLVAETV